MNPALRQLIPAVVSYLTEHGGWVTKTKLLKLLYLFDVEYYRAHRETFTAFQWRFFHLGPWAREFDPLLDELVAQDLLVETQSSKPDFETKFYRTPEPVDLSRLFSTYQDEAAIKSVLDRWGDRPTGEILDYVYFRTEPMEYGLRNEPLDFIKVAQQPAPIYTRPPSGKTRREIEALRKKFREQAPGRITQPKKEYSATTFTEAAAGLPALKITLPKKQFGITPPRYDEEFFEAMLKLDKA